MLPEMEGLIPADWQGPPLRDPIALVAFRGWHDANFAGSRAVWYLRGQLSTEEIARLDFEQFYTYTDTRPTTFGVGPYERGIRIPRLQIMAARLPESSPHDLVLLSAPEPNLRWKAYMRALLAVLQLAGVTQLFALGSLRAAVHHQAPVHLTGWANTPTLRGALQRQKVTLVQREGPTGFLVQVVHAAREANLPAAALLGFSPHYLQGTASPFVSLALLRGIRALTGIQPDLSGLEREGTGFLEELDRLLSSQPDVRAQLEKLRESGEQEEAIEPSAADEPPPPRGELPNAQDLVDDLEQYLRRLRGEDSGQ